MHDANFLSLIHDGYPARLASSQTAKLLGFGDHDIPVLVATGLLKPLGSPVPNAPKHFALVDVLSYATDREWLNRATRTLAKHWKKKNCEQRNKRGSQNTSHISEAESNGCESVQPLPAKVPATGGQK